MHKMAIGNMKQWWKHISLTIAATYYTFNTFTVSTALAYLTAVLSSFVIWQMLTNEPKTPQAPGPKPWPILGSLHLMDGFRIPFAAFTKLSKEYGNVFSMKLGSSWCVIVNDPKSVKEVLITKGAHFDARPTLKRFDLLFGGDKENSLAFCNNSEPQKKRRQILQKFTFPHSNSNLGTYLDQLCSEECQHLVGSIHKTIAASEDGRSAQIDLKPLVVKACANIFNRYFCSSKRNDYNDEDFTSYCHNFDKVFWEVNNSRAVDMLPWLMPFYKNFHPAIATMKEASFNVRQYVKEKIIAPKRQRRDSLGEKTADFLDTIMDYIDGKANDQKDAILTSQSALYALEDILGGHSAVANITLRILFDLALNKHDEAKKEVKQQIDEVGHGGMISLEDRPSLPRVVASMHETIRMTCSPIVPHLATQDSSIEGHFVPKDTVIFVNNHILNMSEELWEEPESFKPDRFLDPEGNFSKPAHFQPFSMGKRSCMGYKMVHNVAFSLVANLMLHFDLGSPQWSPDDIPLGMLALPPQPFQFTVSTVKQPSYSLSGKHRSVA